MLSMLSSSNVKCSLPGLDHVHTTNELHQCLFVSGPRPPLQGGLGLVVLVHMCIRTSLRKTCAREPHQASVLTGPNSSGLKGPQNVEIINGPTDIFCIGEDKQSLLDTTQFCRLISSTNHRRERGDFLWQRLQQVLLKNLGNVLASLR